MKTELTFIQSQHLLDLGIPKEKASIHTKDIIIFKLEDFLNGEILPKEIEKGGYVLTMYGNVVGYAFGVEYEGLIWNVYFKSKELIDALYQLTCWYYGEYLKSKKK